VQKIFFAVKIRLSVCVLGSVRVFDWCFGVCFLGFSVVFYVGMRDV
jgi:hypothetical protein